MNVPQKHACDVSNVSCHMSQVICHKKYCNLLDEVVELVAGGSVINGATQSRFVFWWYVKNLNYGIFCSSEHLIFNLIFY